MKTKKFLFLIVAILFWLFLLSNKSFAGTQKWNSLDYDVTINSDGSINVVETMEVYISQTNTLFKDFKLDYTKYSGITDVSVMQISPNEVNLNEIYTYQYHVDPGCFYALDIGNGNFEIAWHVGLDNSQATRKYQIKYKILNPVTIYKDCTEFYWMFIDKSNSVDIKNITGRIYLPKSVSDMEKLRVWGHGPLNANISKNNNDTVVFNCRDFKANSMLEVRVVTEENIYESCTNISNMTKLDSILTEEIKWADKANSQRNRAKLIWGVIYGVIIVLAGIMIKKIIKYKKAGYELTLKYSRDLPDIKYFRDIPDEKNATPARASYLYNFMQKNSYMSAVIPQIFSATMLNFALKGIIEFEPIDSKNFNIIIKNRQPQELTEDEQDFLDILKMASKDQDSLTTKELLKYTKVHYENIHNILSKIPKKAEKYHNVCGNIDEERKKINSYWNTRAMGYSIVCFIFIFFLFPFIFQFAGFMNFAIVKLGGLLGILYLVLPMMCFRNAKKVSALSDKGEETKLQWKGLKNYMMDFSLLKDKEVPDLVLWEKYLVYATAFGISKEVIKQLKIVYPEMSNPDYYSNRNYRYMYYMSDSRFGNNFIHTFNHAMTSAIVSSQNAYSQAHSSSSSGSGGGGGFSGGGGGRRRWR